MAHLAMAPDVPMPVTTVSPRVVLAAAVAMRSMVIPLPVASTPVIALVVVGRGKPASNQQRRPKGGGDDEFHDTCP